MSVDIASIFVSAAYNGITLYMLLIIVRWLGPFLELDFYDARLRWIGRAVDPVLRGVRRVAPPIGPFDAGPVIALLLLWLFRTVAIEVLIRRI